MYRPRTKRSEKAGAVALAVGLQGAMVLAFLNLADVHILPRDDADSPLITILPEDPPPPPILEEEAKAKPKDEEGKAAPPNQKSKATEVVKPEPKVKLPVKDKVVAAPIRNSGAEATNGNATPGPGTGAGGVGNGTGSGGQGMGGGGGGQGGRQAGVLRGITDLDYPREVANRWPKDGTGRIFTRLRVEANGQVSKCDVLKSFGDKAADLLTCSLLVKRGKFRPATDASGRPIAGWVGYIQRFVKEF